MRKGESTPRLRPQVRITGLVRARDGLLEGGQRSSETPRKQEGGSGAVEKERVCARVTAA